MRTFTRLLAIALVASAALTACGGGGGGGGASTPTTPLCDDDDYDGVGPCTPTTPLSNGDVVIDALAFGLPPSPVVSTSFEFSAIGGFSIGAFPFTATFSNGNAETRGNQAFYISGLNAWHILNGTSATVTFGTPPSTLSFWVRTVNAADVSTIEIFDVTPTNPMLITTVTPTTIYTQITVTRMAGETLIGSMVVTN